MVADPQPFAIRSSKYPDRCVGKSPYGSVSDGINDFRFILRGTYMGMAALCAKWHFDHIDINMPTEHSRAKNSPDEYSMKAIK